MLPALFSCQWERSAPTGVSNENRGSRCWTPVLLSKMLVFLQISFKRPMENLQNTKMNLLYGARK